VAYLRRLLPLLLLVVVTACQHSPTRTTVRIAAASDLRFALQDLTAQVTKAHPDLRLQVTYGSSGTFRTQLENGAPFDLFLSADIAYPEELAAKGLAARDDVFSYAVGRLVVWTGRGSPVDPKAGLSALTDPRVRKVSIADPATAPYGRAAVAALETEHLYDTLRPKLVTAESVAQAAEFVTSGNADAGLVAESLVLGGPLRGVGRWSAVPLSDYPRLVQGGVVMAKGRTAAAREVRDVMLSAAGRALLANYGFSG